MRYLILAVVALLPTVAEAQIFGRIFGGKSTAQYGSSCPGGVCPTAAAPQATYRPIATAAVQPVKAVANAGHWSYPGDITSHLESTHGVATAGMSRQQKLDLHDSLHEGTAGNYRAVSSAIGYGSSGSTIRSGGSSGGFGVGSVLPDGAVVTSVGVTVPASAEASEMRAVGSNLSERVAFRRALLAAGRKARESGTITTMEFFVLSAASRNPIALQRMQEAVQEAAIEDGLASAQAVDWDSLIAFIEKLIPLIIKLIDLFS